MTQIANPARLCEVNTMLLPSGDQSGSLGLGSPPVLRRRISPPVLWITKRPRRSSLREAKQIFVPSGDQQGELSSVAVLVSCVSPLPSMFETHRSGLPPLLRIIATLVPSGEIEALEFRPGNRAKGRRSPV